jgi:beta-glucosidase
MGKQMAEYEKQHIAKMRQLAPECMVLLKRGGDFPLEGPGEVALYGNGARCTIKGGTGSGDVNARFYVTAEEGLEKAGFTVTTKGWMDGYDRIRAEAKDAFIRDIKRRAKEAHVLAVVMGMGAVMPEPDYELPLDGQGDMAIYVLSRICGEGNDRQMTEGDLKLTRTEVRDILACNEKYAHFLLVLNVGSAVDLTPVSEVKNILLLSQLGVVTGDALADVILGRAVPSGKLSSTWAKAEDIAQISDFGDSDETRYREGIYVGYRYYGSDGKAPVYPFGFGLGYTDFAFDAEGLKVSGCAVSVQAKVKNTGAFPGKETLQLYVTAPWSTLDHPYLELAAFHKTSALKPGAEETCTLSFDLAELASFDAGSASYVLEEGRYVLRLGTSSADAKAVYVLELPERVTVCERTHIGGTPDFEDWKPEHTWEKEDLSGLEVTKLSVSELRDAFAKEVRASCAGLPATSRSASAAPSGKATDYVKKLPEEQLVRLVIGNYGEGGILSVIGEASTKVAGAAGETYGKLPEVPPLVMADGPAGLRLSRQFVRTKKGPKSVGSPLPAGMEDLLPGIAVKWMNLRSRAPKGEVLDQYCTAIPIGTALAQSWNPELIEACGDVVGAEMERFGIDLWLAPAINIHRHPLCGRNFEYCSEDPLLSGTVGAAITRGVQRHPGRLVTIKHFCANNQEFNRYQNDSIVSERALREIYLRSFSVCLREGNPGTLMTSYNLLNGTHTSERSDLLRTFLREEMGWDGLIMTDWIIGNMNNPALKNRTAHAAPTIKAGNELFMPGSKKDAQQVLDALHGTHASYHLTREEIEVCAARVADTVWKLKKEQ